MADFDPAYLAHEYFGAAARALAVDEVHGLLGPFGLAYAASATIVENIDGIALPAGVAELVAETHDPVMRETMRDLGANKSFRRDLFRRGPPRPGAGDRALDGMSFALQVPADEATFTFDAPLGPVSGHPHLYGPLVERLMRGPAGFAELAALPAFAGAGRGGVVEALSLMVHAGRIAPLAASAAEPEPAHRFNRTVVELAGSGLFHNHLASPVTRSGVSVESLEMLLLARPPRPDTPLDDLEAARLAEILRLGRFGASPLREMDTDALKKAEQKFIQQVMPLLGSLRVSPQA